MDTILAACYPFLSEWSDLNNPSQIIPFGSTGTEVQIDEEYFPTDLGVNLVVGKIQDHQQKEFPVFSHFKRDEQFNIVGSSPKISNKPKHRYIHQPKVATRIIIELSTIQILIDHALELDEPVMLKSTLTNLGDRRKGKKLLKFLTMLNEIHLIA